MKKVRVAFVAPDSGGWLGGANYFKNLFFAISKIEEPGIELLIFSGVKSDKNIKENLCLYSTLYESSLFDRFSMLWFLRVIVRSVFKKDYILNLYFKNKKIDVLSHAGFSGSDLSFKTINWIPDFQHHLLPEMFSKDEIIKRDNHFFDLIHSSDALVLSSNAAYQDLKKYYNIDNIKTSIYILNFVSQPYMGREKECGIDSVIKKYNLPDRFFYFPGQFWKHKNHAVIFKAVKLLKGQGCNIAIVCTGDESDYRNKNYFNELMGYVVKNNLGDNVHSLGVISFDEVVLLMRYSISVINPSLFEGWSSTVEECKSIGKKMILSNIDVHLEQNPPMAEYFSPQDEAELAEILYRQWFAHENAVDLELESKAKENLEVRTLSFANKYQNIVMKVVG